MNNTQQLEALLFFKAAPMRLSEISGHLNISEPEVENALNQLEEILHERGIKLARNDGKVLLTTTPDAGDLIERVLKEELEKDLGKAGLEVLTTVLYRGPVTRAEVDYIRGVNSTYTLRMLQVRGLVERIHNPKDQRSYLYKPTFELLSHLGISNVKELPEYDNVKSEIESFEGQEELQQTLTQEDHGTNE